MRALADRTDRRVRDAGIVERAIDPPEGWKRCGATIAATSASRVTSPPMAIAGRRRIDQRDRRRGIRLGAVR